jgi:hypothetical protein
MGCILTESDVWSSVLHLSLQTHGTYRIYGPKYEHFTSMFVTLVCTLRDQYTTGVMSEFYLDTLHDTLNIIRVPCSLLSTIYTFILPTRAHNLLYSYCFSYMFRLLIPAILRELTSNNPQNVFLTVDCHCFFSFNAELPR